MIPYNYSLIIPHYNIPCLLDRLLETIPIRDDLQVIVVDDCSSDENNTKLKEVSLKYPRVEFYSTGMNGGGGKARNIGLKYAYGKYVIFADADDYFNICFSEALTKYANSDFDIVYFASNSVDTITYQKSNRDCAITPLINKYIKEEKIDGIKYHFTAPWCRFISRSIITKYDIKFAEVPVYNDMFFCLCVEHRSKKIQLDPLAIYCVTDRKNSVSSVSSYNKEFLKLESVKQYYMYAKAHKLDIAPLYCFMYPMINILRREKGKGLLYKSIESWKEAGIGKHKFTIYYWKGYFNSNILTPLIRIVKSLISMHKR